MTKAAGQAAGRGRRPLVLRGAETTSGDEVPDPFERLQVMVPGPGGSPMIRDSQ
jgi:hypothetical protein